MTHIAATAMIFQHWTFAWAAGELPAMPVEFDNMKFKQPDAATWGRLTLTRGDSTQIALGGPGIAVERTPFILNLQVFIPENQGTRDRDKAADAMRKLNRVTGAAAGLVVNFYTASIGNSQAEIGSGSLITIGGYYDLTAS